MGLGETGVLFCRDKCSYFSGLIPSTISRTASASMTIEAFSLNLMLIMRVKQHCMSANVFVITAVNGQNPIASPQSKT